MSRATQAVSNSAMNSEPPSTCTALSSKGRRVARASRMVASLLALALRARSSVSQRLMTSCAVNCLSGQLQPGMRTSTRSPSRSIAYPRGSRMAWGRVGRCRRLVIPRRWVTAGSPRSRRRSRMRLVIEAESSIP